MINPGEPHLHLLLQVRPARPVSQGAVQERFDPGETLGEESVERDTHPVYELHLHLGQLVLPVPVHHPHGVDPKLVPFHVPLVEELVGHLLSGLVLELPGLGDGGHVRRRHEHAGQQLLLILGLPVDLSQVSRALELLSFLEVAGEVRGQDCLLQDQHHLLVILSGETCRPEWGVQTNELPGLTLEDVISLAGENHHALIKVVMFHCRCGVENRQGRVNLQKQNIKTFLIKLENLENKLSSVTHLCLVGVVRAPVVQIMAETGHQQTEHLQVVSEPVHLARLQHSEHRLADIESVPPVVVFHWTIVLLHTQSPPTDNLVE